MFPATLTWAERLVAIDTTSRHSNLGLIETVRDALRALGLAPWLAANAEGDKANLFCTLPARDGGMQGGIALSGHTDVVPVDGQTWVTDPFRLTARDGRLYGRGAADMKGFIACALALAPQWLAMPGGKPLHLALSYDEEVGCLGAPVMLARLRQRGIRIDGCVVGEPTGMRPVVAHKGINLYHCCVQGRAAHSSLTQQGCNAIEYAARLIGHIRSLADALRRDGPFDACFDVPWTTISTNQIAGGSAINIVPQTCTFDYEFRNLPQVAAEDVQSRITRYVQDDLLPRMQREFPDARITLEPGAQVPALDASEQAAITQLARALTNERTAMRKVAYATEAGLFQRAGVPAIVCGPGAIEQAHKADEYIDVTQLDDCERFLWRLAQAL